MLGNLHVRFGVGAGGQFPGPHHHLGAALVLLTETREGYAYRLRAIGHLFEAEDESQEWPELHAAIREARKAYQADGTLPDWDTLATRAHERRAALAAEAPVDPTASS